MFRTCLSANAAFFLGSNNLGQSAPSYISAPACGITTPTDISDVGFPDDHIILDLNGAYYTAPSTTLVQIAGIARGGLFPVGVTTNTFRATDAAGNTSTCSFTVTVNDVEAPVFTTCPAGVIRNTDAGVCYATYTPAQPVFTDNCAVTKLTWVMTGATTGSSPATGINYVPSTQFQLTGTTGQGITTITYTATDAAGNTKTCVQTITVNDASIPVISVQPSTKFVCVGSDAVFSVTATAGTGNPLTYQWQQWNGSAWVNITGATASTFTIPTVSFALNTNTYRVVLTGRCSVVISAVATLYINPLPTVSLVTSIPPSLLPSQSLTITANVSPAGGSFVWRKDGNVIGATGSSLSGLTVDDIGTYRVTYTDPNGCVSTSADVVVTGQASDKLWVYPNPNFGQFQVRFYNTPGENATVRVYDAKGAKVYERAVATGLAYTQIDVELGNVTSAGMYVVELVNGAGKRVGAKKIDVRRRP
ncbi:MAG: HYR domain-containing protein [Chitinophagaceae bacterium]